ncbi:MAG: hypothetical protein ABJH63_08835 [Rhizobiaceae bacterium]
MSKDLDDLYAEYQKYYRHDVVEHLVKLACQRKTITYGELAEKFGGIARGRTNPLTAIAVRCRAYGEPLISVLVVLKGTKLPSPNALIYPRLGLTNPEEFGDERERCFDFDWSKTELPKLP